MLSDICVAVIVCDRRGCMDETATSWLNWVPLSSPVVHSILSTSPRPRWEGCRGAGAGGLRPAACLRGQDREVVELGDRRVLADAPGSPRRRQRGGVQPRRRLGGHVLKRPPRQGAGAWGGRARESSRCNPHPRLAVRSMRGTTMHDRGRASEQDMTSLLTGLQSKFKCALLRRGQSISLTRHRCNRPSTKIESPMEAIL